MNPKRHLVPWFMSAGLFASLAEGQMTGQTFWSSSDGVAHACRGIEIEVWAARSTGDIRVSSAFTDLDGNWSVTPPAPDSETLGYFVIAVAHTEGGRVGPVGGTEGMTYRVGIGPGPTTIGNTSPAERAFGITDAIFSSHYYATHVTFPSHVTERYVEYPGPEAAGSHYSDSTGRLTVSESRWQWWDVINHEYSHYIAQVDHLDRSPGGTHDAGSNMIALRGKDRGARLAYSEGLATFQGLRSQSYGSVLQQTPTLSDVGNADYETPGRLDTIESMTSGVGRGEGDELSVARVLWDMNDEYNAAEPWDRVEVTSVPLYTLLQGDGTTDRLSHIWNRYVSTPGRTNRQRADLGAVFSENGVSPKETSGLDGSTFTIHDAPAITFLRGNGGFNDRFGLMVFSDDMTTLVAEFTELSVDIPGMSATFHTDLEWSALLRIHVESHGGSAALKFVLWGRDTKGPGSEGTGAEVMYTGADITGDYWSAAYSVIVTSEVPAPGACGLLAGLGVVSRRRRRA